MSDQHQERPTRLGAFDKASSPRMAPVEIIAGALSVIWLVGVAVAFLGLGVANPGPDAQPIDFVMLMLAVFMPIALIWVAAAVAKTARVMREEAMRLQAAITAMRLAYLQQSQPGPSGSKPGIEKKLDELAQAQRQTEAAVVQFASRRDGHMSEKKPALAKDAGAAVAVQDGQPALALGSPSEVPSEPISVADFIKAANFPETAEDKDGFRALRLALEDREASKLIRSAQDVLTLLSQDGIYMDDLRPDRTKPELWRRFAAGERAGPIAALGGIRDRSCLALTSARMRSDPVFRDTAHHYLRQFDRTLIGFEETATDAELAQFADTRSARAFMLLGRVTGMFD